MSETTMDLCQVLNEEMKRIELNETISSAIVNNPHYVTSQGQATAVQKTYLTLALAGILSSGKDVVPPQIRLGLNMAGNINDWLTDIKLIVLPFIKANEDKWMV